MKKDKWMSAQTPLLLAMMLMSAAGVIDCRAERAADAPNVLFIAVDDLVPRLGCYGDRRVKSPQIDRLASQGTTFLHAQCQYPVCGPSRASLMSGLRPESAGVLDLKTKWREANPDIVSLPQHLKDHGYLDHGC
jgi:arylsulfatase A-like enzyme